MAMALTIGCEWVGLAPEPSPPEARPNLREGVAGCSGMEMHESEASL